MTLTPVTQPVRGKLASGAFSYSLFPESPRIEREVASWDQNQQSSLVPSPTVNNPNNWRRFATCAAAATGVVGCQSKQSRPESDLSVSLQTSTLVLGVLSVFLAGTGVYLAARRAGLTKRTEVPDFYEDLNRRVNDGNLDRSIGRDQDYQRLRDRFYSDDEKITVIVGPKGCGKGHFLFGLAHEILRQGSIQEFNPSKTLIMEVTLEKLLGFKDFSHFPTLDAKMRLLKKTIDTALESGKKVILIVDTFQRINSTGATEGNANDHVTLLYTQIRQWRKDPRIRLLGATSENDYRRHIEGTDIADDIFPFYLSPIEPEALNTIVTKKAKSWENSKVHIHPEAVERAIALGQKCEKEKKLANPQAAIDLLEAAKNRASRMATDGKKNQFMIQNQNGSYHWVVNSDLINEIAQEQPFNLDLKDEKSNVIPFPQRS